MDAVITIDSLGRVLQFNRAAEQMFGYRREFAIGRELADLIIPPDLRAEHWAGMLRLTAGADPRMLDRRIELRGMRSGGEQFPIELTVTKTSDSPPAWTGFVRDLTLLERSRASRRQEGASIRRRRDPVADGQLGARPADAARDLVGRPVPHPRPRPAVPSSRASSATLDYVHVDDRERTAGVAASVVESPEDVPEQGMTVEYRVVRPDGVVREMRARGRIEVDDDGRPVRWVGVAQDITEQRLTERELRAHDAVEQSIREWASFDEGATGLLRLLGTALEYELGSLWTWNADAGNSGLSFVLECPGARCRRFRASHPCRDVPARARSPRPGIQVRAAGPDGEPDQGFEGSARRGGGQARAANGPCVPGSRRRTARLPSCPTTASTSTSRASGSCGR